MGKLVEAIAKAKNHEIVSIATAKTASLEHAIENADVCIDFSHPANVLKSVKACTDQKKNLVMGTTGWYDQLEVIREAVSSSNIGFLYAPNFSIGVNLFMKIVNEAAKLVNQLPQYDIGMAECHHNQKADSPSGTALALAQILVGQIQRKNRIVSDCLDRAIFPEELHISTLRLGNIPGTHSIIFDSPADTLTLTHEARNREGFATGAVFAAEWLYGKQGFYTLQDTF